VEEVTRPGDTSSNSWQVSNNGWVVLVLLILVFDLMNLESIVVEEDGILGAQTVSQVLSLEDSLKLSKEL
jgi:hypothetical protein